MVDAPVFVKDLRADMAVVAHQADVGKTQGEADKILCLPGFDCDAEFGVDLAGGDGFIGVRVDARRQTQQHLLPDAPALCLAADDFQLLRMVGNKIADVCCHRIGNVGIGFVVAVEEGALHLKARALCRRNLARGDDVDRHALVLHDGVDALEAGGFAGVERKAPFSERTRHRGFIHAAVLADAVLVHKIQRRFVVRREPDRILARKRQVSAFVDADVAAKHFLPPLCF